MMRNLFPGRPAIGSTILINDVRFEVVGVLANIGREENNMNNVRDLSAVQHHAHVFPHENGQNHG